jgi:tetratricopeptide (TPR) repeat protein
LWGQVVLTNNMKDMKRFSLYKIAALLFLFFVLPKISAQQPYTITLRVNYNAEAKVYHNEPVLFTVSVTNKEAQENNRWNNAADRRLNELEELLKTNKISREDYDKEKKKLNDGKKEISSVTVGSSDKGWPSMIMWKAVNTKSGEGITLVVKTLPNPSTEPVAMLGDKGYYQAYFGIDPDDLKKLPDAEYDIIAAIEGKNSDPVHVQIQREDMPATVANSEEMLLKMGQYYWHSGDSKKTMQYAEMILAKNSASIDGLSLKGDAQVMEGSYQPALETYNKAVKEFYKQNPGISEPPEYLLEMIELVKKQL